MSIRSAPMIGSRSPDPAGSDRPRNFAPTRAPALGFRAETSFDEIIRAHIEDELGGRIGG